MALGEKRTSVKYLKDTLSMSVSRGCHLFSLNRSLYYYEPHPKTATDTEVKAVLEQWTAEFSYYGFWMLYNRLRLKHKPVYRVYKSLGLNFRPLSKRKRIKREVQPMKIPTDLNESWSMDFVSDALVNRVHFRMLNILDDCSREVLAAEADTSIFAQQVICTLERVLQDRPAPQKLSVNNGPEFIAKKMEKWARQKGIELKFI